MKWKTGIVCLMIILFFTFHAWCDEPRDISEIDQKISLDFDKADIKFLLNTLFREIRKLNFVFDECVQGKVTIKLENVPVYDAFRLFLENTGLDYEQEGNVIRIYCKADSKTTTADSNESISFAADEGGVKKGDITTDGLTIVQSSRFTETEIKKDVNWSGYTKYEIAPVEVSFQKNWKRDYNRDQKMLSLQVTDKDMARIRKTMGKILREELDKALQKKGNLTEIDEADANTLLFKPRIINLDIYAPDVENSPYLPGTYVRQVGKATLFLEVYDSVSGEILGRWVDTSEDPDRGYFDWANRITNNERMRFIMRRWADRLVKGLDHLEAVK